MNPEPQRKDSDPWEVFQYCTWDVLQLAAELLVLLLQRQHLLLQLQTARAAALLLLFLLGERGRRVAIRL